MQHSGDERFDSVNHNFKYIYIYIQKVCIRLGKQLKFGLSLKSTEKTYINNPLKVVYQGAKGNNKLQNAI